MPLKYIQVKKVLSFNVVKKKFYNIKYERDTDQTNLILRYLCDERDVNVRKNLDFE